MRPNSFTTAKYKWLHSEAWTDRHFEYFVTSYQHKVGKLSKIPSFQRGFKTQPPQLEGRWILETTEGQMCGWAEVTGIYTSFRKSYFLVDTTEPEWTGEMLDQLSFLISAIFIATKSDLIRVISSNIHKLQNAVDEKWGNSIAIKSPIPDFLAFNSALDSTGQFYQSLAIEIDPLTWWQTPRGRIHQKNLTYLGKRREIEIKRNQITRRSGSVFNRLFAKRNKK